MPNFQAIKVFYNMKNRNIAQKIPTLTQATSKNNCQNFPTPKNPEIENFKPEKNPSVIP